MNAIEMADKITDLVLRKRNVTFIELVNEIGEEAIGESSIANEELKVVFWDGISKIFYDALQLAMQDKVESGPCHYLVYFFDGTALQLPIAKRLRAYKNWHWLPTIFNPKVT
jgi:hypothetical protein